MEEDKNTSKVEKKRPYEEDCETTTGRLFKHPKNNESEEISDENDDGYGGRVTPLFLKVKQALEDYDAKEKKYAEAGKICMEAIKGPIRDLYAKQKIWMEAIEERNDALLKSLEAQREYMWKQQLIELSEHTEIIPLIPIYAEFKEGIKERARALLLGMIAKWEEELELLRVEAMEHQVNQQRLLVEIAFAVSNANLTNGDIAKIASATLKVNLTNDAIAAKEKLLREKRAEFGSST